MGRVCSVLMPVVTLQSFKMIGHPEVLIGAWSMTWYQCEKIVKNWHQAVKWTFFVPKLILMIPGRPNRFNGSISTSLVNLKKIGQGHIFALSRDQVT